MKPGRELDALVAEKVMGWKWMPWVGNREQYVLVPAETDADSVFWWGRDVRDLVPPYSTDIAAAWQVWKRFDGWVIQRYEYDGVDNYVISSGADTFERGEFLVHTEADGVFTLPHAICLSALRAVGAL